MYLGSKSIKRRARLVVWYNNTMQSNHHSLLLAQFGDTRRVVYAALLGESTLKFGFTDELLKTRVAQHMSTFRRFELVGVWTGLQFPRDLENRIKTWAREQQILSTAYDKRDCEKTEIISLATTPLFQVIYNITVWSVEQRYKR